MNRVSPCISIQDQKLVLRSADGSIELTGITPVKANEPHYLAVTWSGVDDLVTLHYGSSTEGSLTSISDLTALPGAITIGSAEGLSSASGLVMEVLVFEKALACAGSVLAY